MWVRSKPDVLKRDSYSRLGAITIRANADFDPPVKVRAKRWAWVDLALFAGSNYQVGSAPNTFTLLRRLALPTP